MNGTKACCSGLLAIGSMVMWERLATSATVVYKFTGTVTSVDDSANSLGGDVVAGTPYSGTFRFDTPLTDNLPGDSTIGFYLPPIPPGGFDVTVGSYRFVSAPAQFGTVSVYDNDAGLRDRLQLQTQPSSPQLSLQANTGAIAINLWDFTLSAFSSDALSEAVNIDLNDFQERSFSIQARDTATGVTFNIHSFKGLQSFELVPEPAAATLLLIGGLVAVVRTRGRSRRIAHGWSSLLQ